MSITEKLVTLSTTPSPLETDVERTPDLVATEEQLHTAFTSWSESHSARYSSSMGNETLPYDPLRYPFQRLDRPLEPQNRFIKRLVDSHNGKFVPSTKKEHVGIYLGNLAYLRAMNLLYKKSVGSPAVAQAIIDGFQTAQDGSQSIVDLTVSNLESDTPTVTGLTSMHLTKLADIIEFTVGLDMAIAEQHGFKYMDRFQALLNLSLARNRYMAFGRIAVPSIPLTNLIMGLWKGVPPGASAEKHGLSEELVAKGNRPLGQSFARQTRGDHQSIVFGYVPTGSGAELWPDDQRPEQVRLKSTSYTASLTARCNGGNIPVNRFYDEVAIGPVIDMAVPLVASGDGDPKPMNPKQQRTYFNNELVRAHADQIQKLTGLEVVCDLYDAKSNGNNK